MMRYSLLGVVLMLVAVTACSNDTGSAPDVDVETEAALSVEAIQVACPECADSDYMYVRDMQFGPTTLVGDEAEMPPEVKAAVQAAYPKATFVSQDETDDLFVDDLVAGHGMIVSFDEVAQLQDGVVGVDVMVLTARYSAFGQTIQFQWSGTEWQHATPKQTEVTVTTAVS